MSRPFQVDYLKYKKMGSHSKTRKNQAKYNMQAKISEDRLIEWITFYRRNIEIFVKHYMGITLHEYQKFWLHNMHINNVSMIIASRASAKSWLIGVYSVAYCILYPNSKVVIASGTKGQGGLIISEKIKDDLYSKFPNINREIEHIEANNNKWFVKFYNGSTIRVAVSDDRSRGLRSTLNIYEEFRVIPKAVLDAVLKPFLMNRQAPYLQNPKYGKYVVHEESKQIYISSAWYKTEWIWDAFKNIVKMHYDGKNVMFLAFNYLIAIKHKIKSQAFMDGEKETMDDHTFTMEYENIMFGENSNAFFQLNLFKNLKTIRDGFYPLRNEEFNSPAAKRNKKLKKLNDEIRIVSVDLARSSSKKSDNTIISCIKLSPTKKGYRRDIAYMESHNGQSYEYQTLRIKQIFFDFEADYLVIDMQSFAAAIYTLLSSVTKDEARGIVYDAMSVILDDQLIKFVCPETTYKDFQTNTLSFNTSPVIVPFFVTSVRQNSEFAKDLKDKLKRNMIHFLTDVDNAENYLLKTSDEFKKACESNAGDPYIKSWYLSPYKEIERFIIETVNLEYIISSGDVKIDNKNTKKDRYTSVSYGNYFATLLENKYLKEKKESNNNWVDYVNIQRPNYNVKY